MFLYTLFVSVFVLALFSFGFWLGHWKGLLSSTIPYNLPAYFVALAVGSFAGIKYFLQDPFTLPIMNRMQSLHLAYRQILLIGAAMFFFLFLIKDTALSRQFVVIILFIIGFGLWVVNYYIPPLLARLTYNGAHITPTLLVGGEKHLRHLREWMEQKQELGLQPVGIVNAEDDQTSCLDLPRLGRTEELDQLIKERGIRQVLVLGGVSDSALMRRIVDDCAENGCRLLIYNNLLDMVEYPLVCINEWQHNFFSLQAEPLENVVNRLLKRAFDVVVSVLVVLLILGPLALWVKIMQARQSPGPLLYKQVRGGQNGREFTIYKFRTMTERPPEVADEARQASPGDSRIFPFGAFLRRASMDEMPQFLNVLKGDMSVVGPRPHLTEHDELFARQAKFYRTRHFIKPGITGLAQAEGLRGECRDRKLLEARIRRDVHYLSNWSLLMDFYIVLKTAWQIFVPPRSAV